MQSNLQGNLVTAATVLHATAHAQNVPYRVSAVGITTQPLPSAYLRSFIQLGERKIRWFRVRRKRRKAMRKNLVGGDSEVMPGR